MPGEKDGANLTQNSNNGESVVSKILDRLPEEEKKEETKKPEKQETSKKEETKVEEGKETSTEESTAGEEEVVIVANENVVVTEEIAKLFGLEEGYIGKTVTFSEEEIAAVNPKEKEESTESKEVSGDEPITAEVAELLGLPKTFIGKPLSEAGKAYKNSVKWENENNKQIKNLQKQVETLLDKLSNQEINQIEKEAAEEAGDTVPDPVTEPEKFATWLQKRDESIMTKILKKIEENPSIKTAEEVALQNMENETLKALQAGLPDEVDAGEVMDEWFKENKDDYEDLVNSGIYKNKPKKLIKDILTWYKASSFDSLKSTKDKQVKSEVHKKTVENLKAKGNKTKITFGSNPRPETKSNTTVSRILKNLEERNALKQGTPK